MIRRIEVPSPNTALAIGVWRDFDAKPPFDAGTFHYTLIREDGSWMVSYVHESFLPAPQTVSGLLLPNATNGGSDDWEPLFDGRTLNGWFGTDVGQELGRSWRVEDGCLIAIADGPRSSLVTARQLPMTMGMRVRGSTRSRGAARCIPLLGPRARGNFRHDAC
jgi:hypothetical protein